MPVFELYNADGSLQFDLSARVPRVLGTVAISAAGSLSHAGLATGELFYFFGLPVSLGRLTAHPTVTASGTTLSWTAPSTPVQLTYGVF
jgi:hypothetical protein